jgi:hypothetical protein
MWKRIKKIFDSNNDKSNFSGDYEIENLDEKWIFDFEINSYTVEEIWFYDFDDGYKGKEFKSVSGEETIYIYVGLENSKGELTLSREIDTNEIPGHVRDMIFSMDKSPNEIVLNGKRYSLNDESPGKARKAGSDTWAPLVSYTFESGDDFINIVRWGEKNLAAYLGFNLKDYQIDNILPVAHES